MFALSAISISTKHRASEAHLLAEVVATLGLILVIFSLARTRRGSIAPAAVGAYIGAAYFFTSSTSFANPAISVGRMFSDTFAGIAPASVPAFVVAQLVGGVVAIGVLRVLYPDITPDEAAEVHAPARRERPRPPRAPRRVFTASSRDSRGAVVTSDRCHRTIHGAPRTQHPVRLVARGADPEGDRGRRVPLRPGPLSPALGAGQPA